MFSEDGGNGANICVGTDFRLTMPVMQELIQVDLQRVLTTGSLDS
jgi:hypothetical protein